MRGGLNWWKHPLSPTSTRILVSYSIYGRCSIVLTCLFCLDKDSQNECSLLPTSKTEDSLSPAVMKTLGRIRKSSAAPSSRSVDSDTGPANHLPLAKKLTKRQSHSFSASPPNSASELDIESILANNNQDDDDDHSDIESDDLSETDKNRRAEVGTLDADAIDADTALDSDTNNTPITVDNETATPAAANGHIASNVPKADNTSLDAPNATLASVLPLPNKSTWPTWLSMAFPHLETVSTNSQWSLLISKYVLFELSLKGDAPVSFCAIRSC
jgi:hypothetical protein